MKSKALIALILLQLILILNLASSILRHLNIKSINILSRDSIIKNPVSKLHYFYEPIAGTVQIVKKDWLPEVVHYTINKDSLNERYNYPSKKEKGTFRIITLGDSFTYGLNVSTKQNWTELLEDELHKQNPCRGIKKYEVINLGVEGYDIEYEVERYKLRGMKYNPDLVIWTISDFERILEKMKPIISPITDEEKDKLAREGKFYQNWIDARTQILKKMGMKGVINYQKSLIVDFDLYYSGKLLFVLFPMDNEFLNYFKTTASLSKTQKSIYPLGISDIRAIGSFPDGHFNVQGNVKMMEMLLEHTQAFVKNECSHFQ